MSYFLDRDKACETSAITTVNLKTNDQKFGSHIGNMSNPLYLEIDSWVRTTTVSIMFGEKNFAHLLYSMFKTHTCIYILSSLKPAINGRNLPMTSFMTLFTSCTCTCNTLTILHVFSRINTVISFWYSSTIWGPLPTHLLFSILCFRITMLRLELTKSMKGGEPRHCNLVISLTVTPLGKQQKPSTLNWLDTCVQQHKF